MASVAPNTVESAEAQAAFDAETNAHSEDACRCVLCAVTRRADDAAIASSMIEATGSPDVPAILDNSLYPIGSNSSSVDLTDWRATAQDLLSRNEELVKANLLLRLESDQLKSEKITLLANTDALVIGLQKELLATNMSLEQAHADYMAIETESARSDVQCIKVQGRLRETQEVVAMQEHELGQLRSTVTYLNHRIDSLSLIIDALQNGSGAAEEADDENLVDVEYDIVLEIDVE